MEMQPGGNMISGGKIRTRSLRNLILLVMAIHDGDEAARKPVIRSFLRN